MSKLRVVHYLNQFFAGVGGEAMANQGPGVKEGAVGPGMLVNRLLGDRTVAARGSSVGAGTGGQGVTWACTVTTRKTQLWVCRCRHHVTSCGRAVEINYQGEHRPRAV